MGSDIVRTARKEHTCCFCENPIKIGEKYTHYKGRSPRYDGNDIQIGIQFYSEKTHVVFCVESATLIEMIATKPNEN